MSQPVPIYDAQSYQTSFSPAAGGTISPDVNVQQRHLIQLPAGNITIANPVIADTQIGQVIEFVFTQDSVGSRTVSWGSLFNTAWQPAPGASAVSSVSFRWDGAKWQLYSGHVPTDQSGNVSSVSVAPPITALQMVNLWGLGHSLLMPQDAGYGSTYFQTPWIELVANRLGCKLQNLGVQGATMDDVCSMAASGNAFGDRALSGLHNFAQLPVIGTKASPTNIRGLVLLDCVGNDLLNFSGDAAKGPAGFKNATRAAVAILRASALVSPTDASVVYAGSGGSHWSQPAPALDYGLGFNPAKTSTQNDTATITVTPNASGEVDLFFWVYNTSPAVTITVTVDGSAIAGSPFSFANQTNNTFESFGWYVVRCTGLAASSHSIVITKTDNTGGNAGVCYFLGYGLASTTPPYIGICKDPYFVSYSPQGSNALMDSFNSQIDSVVTEWNTPGVFSINLNANWVASTMCQQADGVHPSDFGAVNLATTVLAALQGMSWGYVAGLHNV